MYDYILIALCHLIQHERYPRILYCSHLTSVEERTQMTIVVKVIEDTREETK